MGRGTVVCASGTGARDRGRPGGGNARSGDAIG
jgi:hypothetical protein